LNSIQNIAIFTSIRSEYGLLSPLIRSIQENPSFNLFLIVGGAHLSKKYGETIQQIEEDGFPISAICPFLNHDDSQNSVTNSLSKLQEQIGSHLSSNKIDLLIVLGDRFELIPVVLSAILFNIPIGHISGGETTEGAIDNQIRHAITKLAHLHFPATETYKKNILKMGEEEWRVCVSGEPGLDEILNIDYLTKFELYSILGLSTVKKTICCTFHPQTIDNAISPDFISQLLIRITNTMDFQILVTASNFDHGGDKINEMLERISETNQHIIYIQSLGQKKYYSLLKYAEIMLGNSSSGLVEAQSFNLPVINVGNRQKGRLANPNVFNTNVDTEEIINAIEYVQSDFFRQSYLDQSNIYGEGNACKKIIDFIQHLPDKNLLSKKDIF
jgi:GDP/UDP-N,N'-diacetylbacillosamine 2-epimerase (hydrolysing)